MESRHLIFLLLTWLCAAMPAQRTWRVNCSGGPNVDYLDLPPAVAAAAPGDTIWLIQSAQSCGTSFFYSSAVTIDKPLTIIGMSPLGTPGYSTPWTIPTVGLVQITGIPAGQRVVICNLGIGPAAGGTTPWPPHGIHATDCAGEILLEDVGYNGGAFANSTMRFERCAAVTLRGCTFYLSGEAVTLIDSTMLITNSWLDWFNILWGLTNPPFTQTGPGLWLRNSHATVIASLVEGADQQSSANNYMSMPGVYVESGSLTIGPFSMVRGGYDPWGRFWSYTVGFGPAQVFRDPRAYPLIPGTPPATPRNVYATYHDWLVAGESYRVSVAGPPGGWGMMVVGSAVNPPVSVPGLGLLAMDPTSIAVLGLQQLDPVTGWREWARVCPANVPVGHVFAFQAAVLAPNGTISLALPSPFTVAWPHGQVP